MPTPLSQPTILSYRSPDAQAIATQSASFLPNLLLEKGALRLVGPAKILHGLRSGVLTLTPADIDTAHGDVLMALLADNPSLEQVAHNRSASMARGLDDETIDLALYLSTHGCDPRQKGAHGASALGQAFFNLEPVLLDEWILDSGWTRWRFDHSIGPQQPLAHLLAAAGHMGVLEVVLRHGLDVNQVNSVGQTPLFAAGTPQTVQWLLDHGAVRTHADRNGVDALAWWQGTRGLIGEQLDGMRKALGRMPRVASATAGSIAGFFEAAKTMPTTRLKAEARRLAITGTEQHHGQGLLRAAAERLIASDYRSRSNAEAWFNHVLSWPQAMQTATDTDRALASLVGVFIKDSATPADSRPNALLDRHPASSEAYRTAMLAAIAQRQIEPSHVDALIDIMTRLRGGLSSLEAAPVLLSLLRVFTQNLADHRHRMHAQISPTSHEALSAVLDTWPENAPQWQFPGWLSGLLLADPDTTLDATSPYSLNHTMSKDVPPWVALAVDRGARWGPEDEQVLASLRSKAFARLLEQVRSRAQARDLDSATPSSDTSTASAPSVTARRSLRL